MRIILADQHTQVLRSLRMMLQEVQEFELVGEAANAESLLLLAAEQPVDLVLVDGELPGAHLEDLIASLHALEPRPVVIVMGSQEEFGRRPLKAGADAYHSKGDQPSWLMAMLHRYAGHTKRYT